MEPKIGPKKNTHQNAFLVPKGLLIQLATIAQSPQKTPMTKITTITARKTTAKSSITLFIYLILYNSTNSNLMPKIKFPNQSQSSYCHQHLEYHNPSLGQFQ